MSLVYVLFRYASYLNVCLWIHRNMRVGLGLHDRGSGSSENYVRVHKAVPHPDYSPITYVNDIAVLTLLEAVHASLRAKARPVGLPTSVRHNPSPFGPKHPGNVVWAVGWGLTKHGPNMAWHSASSIAGCHAQRYHQSPVSSASQYHNGEHSNVHRQHQC